MNIKTVAVIGAGPMGRRLAALFAAGGFDSVLEDILPSNLRKASEYLSGVDCPYSVGPGNSNCVRFASSVEDAVRMADLIVDCVPDELESKLEIFSLLDRMAPPRAIFVTPTRHLSIADLASCTYRADRCIAIQFDSDELPPGVGAVLVATTKTSTEVLEEIAKFWITCGFRSEMKLDPAEASLAVGTLF
jgi:3-hydroxybutyryl-CoA dehydrogenase